MRFAGLDTMGRVAARLATWYAPPHKAGGILAKMNPKGFIAPSAVIYHSDLRLGKNVHVSDRVVFYQAKDGGPIELGDNVSIYRDTIMETGYGGSLSIGRHTGIHPRCQLNAYVGSIRIGRGVDIAPNCAFYPYDHGFAPDRPIREQPLKSKGDIIIEDHAWLGVGVIILSSVRIGKGSVIGAGSVVTSDIPDGAIAVGSPARVVKMRSDIVSKTKIEGN
jgi:acetyltransferase-like isoleucine patch superfamily enzyme